MAYERKAGNWLDGFLYFTSESESPDSFFLWTGLSTLAAVIERKIKMRWVYSDIYPNLYIALVGPPGKVHKTSVLRFQERMLYDLSLEPFNKTIAVTSQSISREALIDQMITQQFKTEDDIPISATTIISPELSTFFATSAEKMVEFLTDIYDSPDVFRHTTRGGGTVLLRNAYVNFISATTPSWIADYFSMAFIDQGFASRTIFIYESKPRFLKARPNITEDMWEMQKKLVEDLFHISQLSGEFHLSDEAEAYFEHWYLHEWQNERLDYRLESYHARKPLMMRKLALLLSVAQTDAEEVDLIFLKMAESLLKSVEPSMARTFAAVGKNKYASIVERMFNSILFEGEDGIDIETLRRQNFQDLGKRDFDENLANLIAMGAVDRKTAPNGRMFLFATISELS